MSNKVLTSNLSTEGITKLIGQLNSYRNELDLVADEIVEKLAERGIKVAEYSVMSDWRQCVEFKYKPKFYGAGELVGKDTTLIHRVWYTSDNPKIRKEREADISPLWMSEFGAGPYALEGHRGTFPGQHQAFKSVWYWYDAAGNRHSSEDDYHMVSTQPMYRALVDMMVNVEKVAREVFKKYEFNFS